MHLCISSSPFSSIAPPSSIQLFNGRHLMILLSWRSEWLNRHTARMCKILNFVQSNHQPHTPEHRRWKFILPIIVFFLFELHFSIEWKWKYFFAHKLCCMHHDSTADYWDPVCHCTIIIENRCYYLNMIFHSKRTIKKNELKRWKME